MRTTVTLLLSVAAVLLTSCGEEKPRTGPASVRGWIGEIEPSGETYAAVGKLNEALRRMEMLSGANVYVENVQFASGGVGEDGSFMILDVPPGNARVVFQIPGVSDAALVLENIPSNADVLIPNVTIAGGKAVVPDPSRIQVRIPGKQRRDANLTMKVAGHPVKAVEVPLREFGDRREYPSPDTQKPVAIVQ